MAGTPVPALPPPITLNNYASVAAPPNGQSASEALYTNGIHAYQGRATANALSRNKHQTRHYNDDVTTMSHDDENVHQLSVYENFILLFNINLHFVTTTSTG